MGEQKTTILICTVKQSLGNGRYLVLDAQGKILTVTAMGSSRYVPGDGVRVVQGVITGKYGKVT